MVFVPAYFNGIKKRFSISTSFKPLIRSRAATGKPEWWGRRTEFSVCDKGFRTPSRLLPQRANQ